MGSWLASAPQALKNKRWRWLLANHWLPVCPQKPQVHIHQQAKAGTLRTHRHFLTCSWLSEYHPGAALKIKPPKNIETKDNDQADEYV